MLLGAIKQAWRSEAAIYLGGESPPSPELKNAFHQRAREEEMESGRRERRKRVRD